MYKLFASGTKDPIGQYETMEELCKAQALDYQTVYNALAGDPCNDVEHDGYETYEIDDNDGGYLYVEIKEAN